MGDNNYFISSLRTLKSVLLAILAIAALCQCSQKVIVFEDPCQGVDVYELGRQDGAQGLPGPERAAADELGQCVPTDPNSKQMKLYKVGRNAGLVEYCTRENGVQVGRSENSYTFVCPELMEDEFLLGYHQGIRIRKLEDENQSLKAEIAELSELLKAEPKQSPLREQSEKQLSKLLDRKLSIEKRLKPSKSL